ncbi:MAG: TIGR02206 family membrane protein [Planctomycetota bacterium]
MKTFEAFGLTHANAVVVALLAWAWVLWRSRGLQGEPEVRFRRRLAIFVIATNLSIQIYRLLPSIWNVDASLPLHLCDFAWMAAIWALWTRQRLPQALVYFWGFGLSWQAFLTPTLDDGPAHPYFWAFWCLHWQIVATALLVVLRYQFRPDWRDFARTVGVTAFLFFGVLGLNLWLDTPYFFNAPGNSVDGTPIALLGDWPLRLLWLAVIVIGLFALMTLPWRFLARRARVAESRTP